MRQVTKPRRLCSTSTQTRVAKIVHHNMGCGGIPIRPAPVPQPQQGSCDSSGGCTTQEPCPPQSPRLFGPSPQDYGLTPRSGFCQKGQELPCLLRPPAANLPSQDHQPSSSARVGQLEVGSLLPTPGRNQDCSIHVGGPVMRRTVTMQSRHEGGVHRHLGASEQGQPVCQDLDSSSVLGIWICQVKISEHGIRDHSAACLPQMQAPQRTPAAPRILPSRTQLGGGQKCREDGHTDTDVWREREGEAKTALKEDSEQWRLDPSENV